MFFISKTFFLTEKYLMKPWTSGRQAGLHLQTDNLKLFFSYNFVGLKIEAIPEYLTTLTTKKSDWTKLVRTFNKKFNRGILYSIGADSHPHTSYHLTSLRDEIKKKNSEARGGRFYHGARGEMRLGERSGADWEVEQPRPGLTTPAAGPQDATESSADRARPLPRHWRDIISIVLF